LTVYHEAISLFETKTSNWGEAIMARSVRELMQAVLDEAALTVDETAVLLSLSRHSAYEGVKTGEISGIRIGRRVLVPTAGLRAMLGIERRDPPEEIGRRQEQPDMTKVRAPVSAATKGGRLRAPDTPAQPRKTPAPKAMSARKPERRKASRVAAE
jgi:excisionase family DNA binding protein